MVKPRLQIKTGDDDDDEDESKEQENGGDERVYSPEK